MIELAKQNISLVSTVIAAGVQMQQRGTRHVGLCPFHSEKTPSFFVFLDNHFKCFGCGEYGDSIDFIQKMHGLSFKGALKFLRIESGPVTPKIRADIKKRKRRAELVRQFKKWCGDYGAWLGTMINKTQKLMKGIPPKDLDLYAPLLHGLPIWKHHSDILLNGSDKEKFEMYKEAHRCRKINLI